MDTASFSVPQNPVAGNVDSYSKNGVSVILSFLEGILTYLCALFFGNSVFTMFHLVQYEMYI